MTQKGLEESSAKMFSPNTVLVAMYGDGETRGRTALVEQEISANQAVCGLLADETVCLPEYLWYGLMSLRSELRSKSRGGNQNNLNQGMIKNSSIPVPPLAKQHEIVEQIEEVMKRIDEINTASERMDEILDVLPKSVLSKAFHGELVNYQGKDAAQEGQAPSTKPKRPDGSGQATLEKF